MPVIYLDILIVLNWLIDYLLLSLTSRILRLPAKTWRLMLGSAVGGVAACQILLPVPTLFAWLIRLFSAALIVRIAFAWHGWKRYGQRIFSFFCISALLSGMVMVLWYATGSDAVITKGGTVYCDISPLWLTVFALVSYGVIRLYERFRRSRAPEVLEYTVTVCEGDSVCECRALYDTGLRLREPFSGQPVIVINRAALTAVLPLPLSEALRTVGAVTTVYASPRLRMIPYRTVSGNGLLPAFVPSSVTLRRVDGIAKDITGVYVALADDLQRGEYTALIGSDVANL